MKDVLLNENNDLAVVNGDFSVGESEVQEVALILQYHQRSLKSDPLLGANMMELIKGKYDRTAVEKRVKIQLERDGKNYDEIKKRLQLNGQSL